MSRILSQEMAATNLSQCSRCGRGFSVARRVLPTLLILCLALSYSSSFAQQAVPTSRGDNSRSGAYTSETLLTPGNVNKSGFGRLFSVPVDYVVMAQPLYMPNVNIPGQGTHNVVYVVTQADSVYAIDADNGAQLWYASMLNGGTTASGKYLPCGTAPGFSQEGIVGTPVIDPDTNTMYLVAKTVFNATVRHELHALDIGTGADKPGSPALITATSTSTAGHVTVFNSLHQKNRPGLLLSHGILYLGFGSNFCNDANSGWVLSYDPSSLTQLAVFNTSPDHGLVSIWQSGNGLAADPAGNLYVETAESGHDYDVPSGGQTFCNSVLKLGPDLSLDDYFTPWTVAFLNSHDLDLSSSGAMVLPDQDGPYAHELIASGKQGLAYVLNRDNLGMFSTNDSLVLQEFPLVPGGNDDIMFSSPAYWNHTVYFTPNGSQLLAYPLSGGLLGTPLKSARSYPGFHSPSISANGDSNGILWAISGGQLLAFDAGSMNLLYSSNQAANLRDKLPAVGHFVTHTVANGRVYVPTRTSLEVYGLLHVLDVTGGNNQSAPVLTSLPLPIQVVAHSPYTGQPNVGVTVSFSDGGKGGSFNPPSAVTDSNGVVSTTYILPQKAGTYALTISSPGYGNVTATETALGATAIKLISFKGAKQTAAAGSVLPVLIGAQARDVYNNGVAGVTVNFSAPGNGTLTPASAVTDSTGLATTSFQLPTTVGVVKVTASSAGLKSIVFSETAVAGSAASVTVTSGNNQNGPAGTELPLALIVTVTDQYGNPVSGVNVTFDDSSAGGSFLNANPAVSDSTGKATQLYNLPASPGVITIHATAAGVSTPAVFNEIAQ